MKLEILIVDDNPRYIKQAEQQFKNYDLPVTICNGFDEGLKKLSKKNKNNILLTYPSMRSPASFKTV